MPLPRPLRRDHRYVHPAARTPSASSRRIAEPMPSWRFACGARTR